MEKKRGRKASYEMYGGQEVKELIGGKVYGVILDKTTSGAIFASVTKKQMETIPLLTPTSDILEKFEGIVNGYDKQIINLFYQNQRLKEARDILLPRLMNGSIEV